MIIAFIRNYLFIYLLWGSWVSSVFCQSRSDIPEPLYIQTDQEYYLAGEQMWVGIFVWAPEKQIESNIVHLLCLGPEGEKVFQQTLNLKGQFTHSHFTLPPDVSTGKYTLLAYTRKNIAANPDFMSYKEIVVYRTDTAEQHISLIYDLAKVSTPSQSNVFTADESNAAFKTQKKQYHPREWVRWEFASDIKEKITFTITVLKDSLAFFPLPSESFSTAHYNTPENISFQFKPNIPREPEKCINYKGSIVNGSPENIFITSPIYVYFPEDYRFIPLKIENGSWEMDTITIKGKKQVQFFQASPIGNQSLMAETESTGWIEDWQYRKNENADTKERMAQTLITDSIYSQNTLRYLLRKRKNYYILNTLFSKERIPSENQNPHAFSPEADEVILRAEYVSFDGLADFFDEKSSIKIVDENGKKDLRLFSLDQRTFYPQTPLILVNGFTSTDPQDIFKLNWTDIEKIELFQTTSTINSNFGPMGFHGVVAIELVYPTSDVEVLTKSNVISIQGLSEPGEFPLSQHNDTSFESLHRPDFRSTIAWLPGLVSDKNGYLSGGFFHTDEIGRFVIKLKGITTSGITFESEIPYEVVAPLSGENR